MLPFIAIGGAISAAATVIKGASWLADKLGSSKAATSAAYKARIAPFEAALAAQAAGQTVPVSGTAATRAESPAASAMILPPSHGTDYDALARMNAGMLAYNRIGEHHGNRAGADNPTGAGGDRPIMRS
jgi:hypothetical protein